jgi:hypothetical protein
LDLIVLPFIQPALPSASLFRPAVSSELIQRDEFF